MYGGGGKHIWSVTYHEFNRFQHVWTVHSRSSNLKLRMTDLSPPPLQLDLVRSFLYLPSACVVKISIVLFNRRITGLASKHWRWFNDGFLAVLVIYLITFTVWSARNCATAIETFLNAGRAKSLPKCDGFPATRVALGLGVTHVVLDFCLLCTPIIVLWKVQMDRSKKVRPFIALLIGAISCVGALMIRVTTNQKHTDIPCILNLCMLALSRANQSIGNYIDLEKWVLIDLFFGLLVASLPVLQGQLPKSWGLFKAYAHSHNHSHRSKPLPGSTAGTDRTKQGIYHQYDLESKSNNFRSEVDDEIELLAQRKTRPPADGHQPPMVFITAGDVESKTSKASKTSNQQSRDESPE